MIRLEMKNYNINREVAKTYASSSSKIGKHEYVLSEEILPSDQIRMIEEAKVTYSTLGETFKKQTKTTEDQGRKQAEAFKVFKPDVRQQTIKDVIPEDQLNEITKNEIGRNKEL